MYKSKKDFIERTIAIVRGNHQGKETTLLINCMLGMLVFIEEKYPERIQSAEYTTWGISKGSVTLCKDKGGNNSSDIKDVVRHLRNSVSHGYFEVENIGKNEITHIEFKDCPRGNTKKPENFEASISVDELEPFLLKFSESILEDLKK
jgi:hypothetical protein